MGAQHTSGPWAVQEDDRVDGCRFIPIETEISSGPKSRLICEVRPDYCEKGGALSETDRANARLIAAAPSLLRALKALRDECSGTPRPNVLLALLAEADLVIAEALGAP